MNKDIKLLIVEDNEDDVLLLLRYLKKEGYNYYFERVETPGQFEEALNREKWDIVISDYSLPKFGGREALILFKSKKIDIPFILVSGTVGEDIAVDMMKTGAHDYIMKTQLKRLVPAIERELKEVEIRHERRNAIDALRESEEQYRNLITYMNEGLIRIDLENRIQYVNKRFCDLISYSPNELLNKVSFVHLIHPDDRKNEMEKKQLREKGQSNKYELRLIKKNGWISWVEISAAPMYDENEKIIGSIALITDVSQRRLAESALKESEIRYQILAETSPAGIFRTDENGSITYLNPQWSKITGRPPAEGIGLFWLSFIHLDDQKKLENEWKDSLNSNKIYSAEFRYVRPDGTTSWVMGQAVPERNSDDNIIGYVGTLTDITERKFAEETLRESETRFRGIFEQAAVGISFIDLSGYFINVNNKICQMLGYSSDELKKLRFQDLTHQDDLEENIRSMDRILTGESPSYTQDKRYLKKDGTVIWATVTASVLRDKNNTPINYIVILEDITYRKQIEEELQRSEERFRTMIQGLSDIITVLDIDGNIVYQSPSSKKVFGYEPFEVIGKNPLELVHPDDRSAINEELTKVYSNLNENTPSTYRLHHKDGHYIHVETVANNMLQNKSVEGVVLTSREITQRLEAEKALKESEHRFKELFNNMGNGVAIYEAVENGNNFIVKDINKAGLKIGRLDKDDVVGKYITSVYPASEYSNILKILKNVWLSGKSQEISVTVHYDDKVTIYTENYIYKLPSGEVVTVYEDVSEKRNAETALRESEEKFSKAFLSSPDIVAITSIRDAVFLEVNESIERVTGYSRKDVLGKSLLELNLLSSKSIIKSYSNELMKNKRVLNFEGEFITKDGESRIGLVSSEVIKLGHRHRLISTVKDITDLKKAEAALVESEKKFRSLFENSQECIYILDIDGSIVDANDSFLNLFGFNKKQIQLLNSSDLCKDPAELRPVLNLLNTEGFVKDLEMTLKKSDGTYIECQLTASARKDDRGHTIGAQGIIRDVTSRKEFERVLIKAKEEAEKADKLKTEFLAQMSHEIRTPINTIFNFVALIREEVEDKLSDDIRESFSIIKRAGKRIIRTIDLILNMSELQTGLFEHNPVDLDLNSIIFDICREYHPTAADKKINFRFIEDEKHLMVKVDEYSVSQIFENLINNAFKYTEEGEITVRSYRDEKGNSTVDIVDTGIGISEEYLPRLFTPFSQEEEGYTRRFEGSGLGLALVKKYCDVNNASVSVESNKGNGSKFTVKFF